MSYSLKGEAWWSMLIEVLYACSSIVSLEYLLSINPCIAYPKPATRTKLAVP